MLSKFICVPVSRRVCSPKESLRSSSRVFEIFHSSCQLWFAVIWWTIEQMEMSVRIMCFGNVFFSCWNDDISITFISDGQREKLSLSFTHFLSMLFVLVLISSDLRNLRALLSMNTTLEGKNDYNYDTAHCRIACQSFCRTCRCLVHMNFIFLCIFKPIFIFCSQFLYWPTNE